MYMRSDYALYVVSIIFFAITGFSLLLLGGVERSLSVVATVVLGFLSVGLGYTLRPTAKAVPTAIATVQLPQTPVTVELPSKKETEAVIVTAPKALELTSVKGIKEKRAAQLKALGISTVEELSRASAEKLAKKLKISPKFTENWIRNAKELTEKT